MRGLNLVLNNITIRGNIQCTLSCQSQFFFLKKTNEKQNQGGNSLNIFHLGQGLFYSYLSLYLIFFLVGQLKP